MDPDVAHPESVNESDDDEHELVRRASQGYDRAFSRLVDRHKQRVFLVAISILGPAFEGEAEELCQEVFLRAHQALRSYRGEARFGSWLYRITYNQALNLKARVRYRAPHLSDEELTDRASERPDALTKLQGRQQRQALEVGIERLPEAYQSVLRLHYWMGKSVRDIAKLLDKPPNTVKSYLFRARLLLRSMLNEPSLGEQDDA